MAVSSPPCLILYPQLERPSMLPQPGTHCSVLLTAHFIVKVTVIPVEKRKERKEKKRKEKKKEKVTVIPLESWVVPFWLTQPSKPNIQTTLLKTKSCCNHNIRLLCGLAIRCTAIEA
eukprot:1151662-Pelagomonas_calceolata.AAC.5